MGQGYSLTTLSAGSANIDIPELADLLHEKSMGTARFMKTIRARHRQGLVLVKAIVKPYPSMTLTPYVKSIEQEKLALADVPNALAFQRILETGNGGYLIRQFIHSSVYDRLSTRPFLEDIEKKWLAFQLLSALRDCHSRDIFHGDIKTENLLVTSWNWLYLADFSSAYKPTYLPEDNPAEFSFYFDTSGRRTCYLAPERFLAAGEEPSSPGITWAMDIFSAGCAIAELFLEGPIFSLSQLFKYRSGDYSPEHSQLSKIEDQDVRELVSHMIQLDPESRYSAEEYLNFWRRKAFPEYFYGFLHQYMALLTDPSSGRSPVNFETFNSGEADEKIDRIYLDYDKISYFLGYGKPDATQDGVSRSSDDVVSLPVSAAKTKKRRASTPKRPTDDGSLIFLAAVASSLRNTAKASARVRACDLLLAFAERLPDEAKLDRVLPFLVTLLNDRSDLVKVAALKSLTQLLAKVDVVSPVNASVFQDYIFPRLRGFVLIAESRPSALVRATYASCIASLAQSSSHILDVVQAVRSDGTLTALVEDDWSNEHSYHTLFDYARSELVAHFEEQAKALLTDPDASVRRAFLGSVSALCVFFGSMKANDVILSHLNTYLNEKDWILKCAFFEALVGVAAYVGTVSLETFVLPLMVQSLTDPEDFVIERVLRSLAGMAELGLFQRHTTWDLVYIVVRLFVHPNLWVREAAVHFVICASVFASAADKYCIIFPMLQPFLKLPIEEVLEVQIMGSLKKPLPKAVFDMAMTWSAKTEKGIFWKAAPKDGIFTLRGSDSPSKQNHLEKRFALRVPSSVRNDEDEQWLTKLRGLGMQQEDEFKLMALRNFIWRVSQRLTKDDSADSKTMQLGSIVQLSSLNVNPTTIMFDDAPKRIMSSPKIEEELNQETPHTIADALLDASTSIDDRSSRNKRISSAGGPQRIMSKPVVQTQGQRQDARVPSQSKSPLSPSSTSSARGQTMNVGRFKRTETGSDDHTLGESLSSSDPEKYDGRRHSDIHALSHRPSAMNLMKRNESIKADAATATTSTNAFGKVDTSKTAARNGPSALALAATRQRSKSPLNRPSEKYKASHTYTGNDPTVLRLLDHVFMENFPVDALEFGPLVAPVEARQPIKRVSDPGSGPEIRHSDPWHPDGRLVVLFGEHTGAVNRICVAPDHAFFLTAADDSTVKIWDATRLEKNLTPRSRQTHKHSPGTKVRSLCFIEDTHTFVSGADDGSIHVVKIDYQSLGGESTKYGKAQLLQEFNLVSVQSGDEAHGAQSQDQGAEAPPEYATYLSHNRTESSNSTVFILTNRSRLIALDLKQMSPAYILNNPAHYGIPTAFCLANKSNWILIGTTHGILLLWDLRFQLLIRTWGIQGGTPVQRLIVHPVKGRGRWVVVAGGSPAGEISVWDVEKMVCREVYRTSPPGYRPGARDSNLATAKAFEPWFPDDVSPETLLTRSAKSTDKEATVMVLDPLQPPRADITSPLPSKTTSIFIGTDLVYPPQSASKGKATDSAENSSGTSGTRTAFMLTGGMDRKVRFWDLNNPVASSIVSGMDVVVDERDKPRYDVSHLGGNTLVVTEWIPSSAAGAAAPEATKGKSRATRGSGGDAAGGKERERERSKLPRSEMIPRQQQQLLRSHMDGVTDCAVLEKPYGMVVSGDRMGCVYVFQ